MSAVSLTHYFDRVLLLPYCFHPFMDGHYLINVLPALLNLNCKIDIVIRAAHTRHGQPGNVNLYKRF